MAFDADAATAAYIDSIGTEALARSAVYTVGSHWLVLWSFVVAVVVAWLIIRSGVLDRLEARFDRRGPNLQTAVVCIAYFLAAGLLSLPWSLYAGWWRNTSYGRSSQSFVDALGQGLLRLGISAVLTGLLFVGVYALMRRTGRRWWLWSGALTAIAATTFLLLAPVLIEPLFNKYQTLPPGPVRDALLSMATEAEVPTDRIFVYDGSRQSNNFTANVGGLGPYARIAISDVALKGASLDEVRAVTAHEIGHYRLNHVWQHIFLLAAIVMVSFFIVDRVYKPVASILGSRAPLARPTSLPVIMVLVSFLSLLAVPIINAFIRSAEMEADRYSLETVNLPDAFAAALVKTAEYRYPRPNVMQELIFYSHPSVERRIREAMKWKALHAGEKPR